MIMKFGTLALSGLLLLASSALARPSTFAERALRRGRPNLPAESVQRLVASDVPTAQSEVSSNWAGVVLTSAPPGEKFIEVAGTFTVPTLAPSSYTAACAWIGIDGWYWDGPTNGLFQAGVDFWMEDYEMVYNAWYEWVPDSSWNFTNFDIAAGDVITLRLVAETDRRGTIYLENETSGQNTSLVLEAPPTPPFPHPVRPYHCWMVLLADPDIRLGS